MKTPVRLALYAIGTVVFATLVGWLVSCSMAPEKIRGKAVSGSGARVVASADEAAERPARVKKGRPSAAKRPAASADRPEEEEPEREESPSVADDGEEEPELTAEEQKLVDRLEEVQGEDGKFSLVRKLAREAKASPRVEVRRAACAALGAYSSKASSDEPREVREAKEALEEQIELFAGDEPEVTTEMASVFREQMLELEGDEAKVALIEKTAAILTDESDLEFMMSEWVNIDDKVAVPSIERVIQSTSGLAHDKAVDAYLLQTSEDYAGAGSAQRWLATKAAE